MFLRAAKLVMVEALRKAFDESHPDEVLPRRIDIGFPEESLDWPALLVDFNPGSNISWTGLNPDVFTLAPEESDYEYDSIRQGTFEGSFSIEVLALSVGEADRLTDQLVELILMGRKNAATKRFWDSVEQNDVIDLTLMEDTVVMGSGSTSKGTPWDKSQLHSRRGVSVDCTGQFYADVYNARLLKLLGIQLLPYSDADSVPGEGDADGNWQAFG